jgi:hypothetical protein
MLRALAGARRAAVARTGAAGTISMITASLQQYIPCETSLTRDVYTGAKLPSDSDSLLLRLLLLLWLELELTLAIRQASAPKIRGMRDNMLASTLQMLLIEKKADFGLV